MDAVFTVSSKNQNKVCIEHNENRPKIVRTAQNLKTKQKQKNECFCIFFSVNGVVTQTHLERVCMLPKIEK